MPKYAELTCEFRCPSCQASIKGPVRFQWGRLPADYKIGDRIKWYRRRSGELVEPFTVSSQREIWNCGSPDIENLYVFDFDLFGQDVQYPCPACSRAIGGVIVEINGGVIDNVRALPVEEVHQMLGEHFEAAEIVVKEDDGGLTVRHDWFNPPLTVTDLRSPGKQTPGTSK